MSITSISMRGGASPWVTSVVEWAGDSATWTLTNTTTGQILYYGIDLIYYMPTTPETIYHLSLTDDIGTKQNFAYVSPPISAPVNLQAVEVTPTSAVLQWTSLEGATSYEVLVDEIPHVVPAAPPEQPILTLAGLDPDRTYSAQVRAFMGSVSSLVSPVIYFTTERTRVAEASEYEYEPVAARTWNAAGWIEDGQPLLHGSGELWGNENGIHTTVFLYAADDLVLLRELQGVQILSAQVSITRTPSASDPRMVLSHWLLHNMTEITEEAPEFLGSAMGVESGSAALGQQAWMAIPTGWVDAILNEEAAGFGWGGVTGRYMRAWAINDPVHPVIPMTGTLRITVG